MPYVFGDSYGGVQGAQQAATNSDRAFLQSLLAAQQQAQAMALSQANQNQNLAYSYQRAQEQRADEAARFRVQQQQQEEDRALREELGLGQLDATQDKIQAIQESADRRAKAVEDDWHNRAQSMGPSIASTFSKLIQSKNEAQSEFEQANQDYLKTDQELAAKMSQGLLKQEKGVKGEIVYVPTSSDDPEQRKQADRFNAELRAKIAAVNEAKAKAMDAQRELQLHLRTVTGAGFVPTEDSIIYQRTGQAFPLSIPEAPKNSPQILQWNPKTGFGNGTAPAVQPAQPKRPFQFVPPPEYVDAPFWGG